MSRNILRDRAEITLILVLFLAFGVYYSLTTPLFEAPDEQWHFAYVQYVAQGHGLPVQTLGTLTHLARQEGSQPPLYYLMAAGLTFWIDTSDYPGIVWDNPHYGYSVPGIVDDNKNLFIHTSIENPPYHNAVLAIHLARLLSVLMGALAVLFTYFLALEIFPDRRYLAAGTAGVVGFVPQFLFISSAVSNDSSIVAATALSLWIMVGILTGRRQPDVATFLALGIAIGLAALAKVSGAGLAVLAGAVVVFAMWRDRKWRLSHLVVFAAAVFVVAGWWYLRNWFLYGELTGTAMMNQIFTVRQAPLTWAQLLAQLREVWETFWVGFGWGNIRANPLVYTLLEILVAASGAGLLIGVVRRLARRRWDRSAAAPLVVLGIWGVIGFIELVAWLEMTQAPHGRLLFPVLPALAPLVVLGLVQWAPERLAPALARVPAISLGVFAAIAPYAILQPAYAQPFPVSASEVQHLTNRLDINYGDQIKLMGYDTSASRVQPGDSIALTLYWQSLARMDEDYTIGIHVIDSSGRVVAARDSYPGHGLLPTSLWFSGQTIRDTYWVPVSRESTAGQAQIQVDVYARASRRQLPAHDPGGQAITPIIGRLKVAGKNMVTPVIQNSMHLKFGQQIELIGYDRPAQGAMLTLYWKRLAPVTADYTVFVHLLDANDQIIAQQDRPAGNGTNPTSLWDEGEIISDSFAFPSNLDASRIEVGLYRADTGERLTVEDSKGSPLGDHVILRQPGVGQ